MSKKQPAPPPAPDYASANREAVMADIETLPQRRLIEAQARLGQGQFAGLGDADLAAQLFEKEIANAPAAAAALLDLQKQYGTQFAEEARRQLEATDPKGFSLRENFGQSLLSNSNRLEDLYSGQAAPTYEEFSGSGPTLETVQAANFADTGLTAQGRAGLERQIFDELARAGSPDVMMERAAQQAVRARGAANGTALSDANALRESLAVSQAQRALDDQRRGNALAFLGSGQSTSDTANRMTGANFDSQMAAVNQRNNAAQQGFANSLEAVGQRNQTRQNQFAANQQVVGNRANARSQDIANVQSFLGLQPIVSQGAQLSGLQQGAAPFMSRQYNGTNINPNAGAQGAAFAGNIFGTQAGIYGQQLQNQSNPLATLGGAFLGAATGGLGSGFGGFLSNKAFGTPLSCHVARLVFGEDNFEWVLFRAWKNYRAPRWFRRLYDRHSALIADIIRPMPLVRRVVRAWMRSKIPMGA